MDILKPMMAAVGSMEPMQMIVMVIILAAIMMGWYYLTKIRPREIDRQEAHDTRMLEIEDRRSRDQENTNTYLREASNSQQVLLTQNTEAVKDLKEIMRIMSETFKEVSEKLSKHDAHSQEANQTVKEIYRGMPTKDDVSEVHQDVQTIFNGMASKEESHAIIEKLDDLKADMIIVKARIDQL